MSDLTELITGLPCFKAPSNITPLGGGITNTNVTVEDEDCKYVVRIGSDIAEHGVMRWNELALVKQRISWVFPLKSFIIRQVF